MASWFQSAYWITCDKVHLKVISMPLLQVLTTAENSSLIRPSKPFLLLPVHEARTLSPKPIPPGLLIYHLFHKVTGPSCPGLWAKSWMRFLFFLGHECFPVATQLTRFYNFTLKLPMIPFSYLHFPNLFFFCLLSNNIKPKDDIGHISLLSVLLSTDSTSSFLPLNLSQILLPQGLCTCCPLPRIFFL